MSRKPLKSLRHALEYGAARVGLALITLCPRAAFLLARLSADFAFWLAAKRRRIACDNLRQAGLASDARQARKLARASFRHLAEVGVECILCPARLTAENWRQTVALEIPPATQRLLDDPAKGIIMISGHLGNWEIGGHVQTFLKPVTAVARPMNNPRTHRLFERFSARGRMHIIPKRSANPRQLVTALRRGDILGLLMDQHANDHAVAVPFFGRPAATHATPARLHRLTGAPIVFQYTLRTGRFRYRLIMSEPLRYPTSDNPDMDWFRILNDLSQRLEAAIRLAPAQYLWAHRRWRT